MEVSRPDLQLTLDFRHVLLCRFGPPDVPPTLHIRMPAEVLVQVHEETLLPTTALRYVEMEGDVEPLLRIAYQVLHWGGSDAA